jgi:predicted alpha/beta superfamily hydrolase
MLLMEQQWIPCKCQVWPWIKSYKAAVVLPNSYAKSKANFPVLYLLHGAMVILTIGCLKLNKTLIQQLSDQYNIIIVPGEKHLVST